MTFTSDGMSTVSGMGGGVTSSPEGKSHTERTIGKMQENKAKKIDLLEQELDEAKEEADKYKKKFKGASSRKTVIENEMKGIREEYQRKFQVLIDKTENDDKLITMLKQTIMKMEQERGVKSGIASKLKGIDGKEN